MKRPKPRGKRQELQQCPQKVGRKMGACLVVPWVRWIYLNVFFKIKSVLANDS